MPDPQSAQPGADRNLLFGILALQMDFISRDALINAMQLWVFNKLKPLGQILLDLGNLSAGDHAWLEAMVEKHLQKHANDPVLSLEAVSSVGSVREELKQITDPDVQASLAHISAARQTENDPLATRGSSVGTPTSAGLRFRILRPHAKGGLGQVSVAHDEELHREVALKEIQERYADDAESRARFQVEAEITGGLEHPGIVPVYGLGHYDDGRPFYAMRFIKGDSLKQAIEHFHKAEVPGRDPGERTLALRQLLGRFVDVCQAVAYAHARGVLHRDLKPSNIMLGAYGETLVVDWGLAKPLGKSDDGNGSGERPLTPRSAGGATPTQMGQVVGTPQYMSPEQAAGRLDRFGPATDVYALGATLYSLLTGKAPFAASDVGAVLEKVEKGDLVAPRQVNRKMPAALEAICVKAMALRPEDRYASALDLAGDVEHWLADEPISCYREPLRQRAGRWARRHKALVAATAAAVMVAVVLGGATAWWLYHQRTALREAVEVDFADLARLQEQAHWAEARAALGRAEARLGSGGPADLRERLTQLARTLDLVDRLDAIRLAEATWVEGHGFDKAGADRAYATLFAEAGLGKVSDDAQIVAERVRDSEAWGALVAALDNWADVTADDGRRGWLLEVSRRTDPHPWRDRVRSFSDWRARPRLERLAAEETAAEQSPALVVSLASRLMASESDATGLLQRALERHPDDFWLNFALGNALAEKQPGEALGYHRVALALRPGSGAVLNNLGNVLIDLGRLEEAKAEYLKAIALDPKFANPHNNLGIVLEEQGRLEEAKAEFLRAITLNPKFGQPHANLGNVLKYQGRLEEAKAECLKAIALAPKSAIPYHGLGNVLAAQGRLENAKAEYLKAIALNSKFAPPHNNLGTVLEEQGRLEEAKAEFLKAIALDPKSAYPLNNLGKVLKVQGRLEEAKAECLKAIALDPKFAIPHNNLGTVLMEQGRLEEAKAEFLKAIALNPKFGQPHANLGNVLKYQGRLEEAKAECLKAIALDPKSAIPYHGLGNVLAAQGRLEEAKAEFLKAIALDPKFASSHIGLGIALRTQGRTDEAEAECRKAIGLDPKLAESHSVLGFALYDQGRLEEAEAEFRMAIDLDPKFAKPHQGLGDALRNQGRLEEAKAEYQQAIAFDPKDGRPHNILATILSDQGRLEEAKAEFRKAIELDPKDAIIHSNLGWFLYQQGRLEEAKAEFLKAITLDPKFGQPHANLGKVLKDQGRLEEAKAEFREAIALDSKNAHAHYNLGLALMGEGGLEEAKAEFRKAVALGHQFAADRVRQCDRLIALARRLPAVIKGDDKPASATGWLLYADLCLQPFEKRYADAARMYAEAFAIDPKRADDLKSGNRYNAACAAALAAASLGKDAIKLADKERLRLRQQAQEWLRADLALWSKALDNATPQTRASAHQTLRHWQADSDLAGLRDAAALAKFSKAEREAWQKLWANVDALRKKAEATGNAAEGKEKPPPK
jgi:tetratricopeptide (TPR) repeat protein/serine/threonine protein kinase